MYTATIQTEFAAGHTLRGYDGVCSRPHGHNWKVTVEVTTEALDHVGMSVDFFQIQKWTEEIVMAFDHRDLNQIPPFDRELNPTSENLAKYIFDQLKKKIPPHTSVASVAISETALYTATYSE